MTSNTSKIAATITPEQTVETLTSKAPTPTLPPQIRTFNSSLHPEFGNLRTLTIDGEPWFVGKDVADALGYANPKNAVPRHVSDEDKLSTQIEYAGQMRTITIINESGLYSLILGSKLESAKNNDK